MFKKAKRKFVLINMLMLSVVLIISFGAIHCTTYFNIISQNKERMENIGSSTLSYMDIATNGSIVGDLQIHDRYFPGFGVIVNQKNELIFDSSFGSLPKDTLENVLKSVIEQRNLSGVVTVSEQKYEYTVQVYSNSEKTNNEATTSSLSDKLYLISFLNVTDSYRTLTQLLITFVITGVITLFAFLCISIYFAKQSIVPIEQSYTIQKQFIQDASHELKTPLASIRANLSVVNSNPNETVRDQQKWLGFISCEVDRMTKLVNDLLSLAQIEYGQSFTDQSSVDLSRMIEDAIASIEVLAFEKNITLDQKIENDIFAHGNQGKIFQVIKILLDNALKYTDSNGYIKVELVQYNNSPTIIISNTGNGIEAEHIPHIFERFYRADSSRKHDGSYGLGLAIAKSFIESMNGQIAVTSIPNGLTTFTIKLN